MEQAMEYRLADAAPVSLIRTLWPHEHGKLEGHLLRLGCADRHLRFGMSMNDAGIRAYCRRARWWNSHLVGWVDDAGALRAVGETRWTGTGWPREAELAFSVETPFQGRGMGTALFRRLLDHAKNIYVSRLYVTSLPSNVKMRRIARRMGLSIHFETGGDCDGRIELRGPDYGSLFSEALEEGTAQLIAALRTQHLLKVQNVRPDL